MSMSLVISDTSADRCRSTVINNVDASVVYRQVLTITFQCLHGLKGLTGYPMNAVYNLINKRFSQIKGQKGERVKRPFSIFTSLHKDFRHEAFYKEIKIKARCTPRVFEKSLWHATPFTKLQSRRLGHSPSGFCKQYNPSYNSLKLLICRFQKPFNLFPK